jgi:hypothetical protein
MIKVLVLGKSLQRQLPVNLVESSEQWAHKLHTAHRAEKLRDTINARRVVGIQSDSVVRRLEFHVLGGDEIVGFAQELGTLRGQRTRLLELVQEDDFLVGSEG